MKKAYFFIDDIIWTLRELTRKRPASLFDNPFLKMLKTAHEKYHLKVQLNLFYRIDYYYGNDEFTLADMTDAYKEEWEACSDWLKFSFHSKQEFPDWPHINASYKDIRDLFQAIEREVFRFAGKNSFTYGVTPHWGPVSKEGVRALADCGVKILWCSGGDACEYDKASMSLPSGYAGRILTNRKPETKVYVNHLKGKALNLCGYNHLTLQQEAEIAGSLNFFVDPETGMGFKKYCTIRVLNDLTYQEIPQVMEPYMKDEYFCVADHEQYFYEEYLHYQPDYAEKIYLMAQILQNNGYEFIFIEELVQK